MSIDIDKIIEEAMQKAFTKKMLDHGRKPRNLGDLEDFNAFGIVTGPCDDTMAIWLKVEDGHITKIGFTTDGCITSLAAGSMTTELAKGKSLPEAIKISQQDVLNALDGLPEESEHCALLAVNTLKEAIANYRSWG